MKSVAAGLLAGLSLALLAGPAPADPKADAKAEIKKELKKMEGNWKMEKQEVNGRASLAGERLGALFDGTEFTLLRDGVDKRSTSKITIDPAKTPKEIDLLHTGGSVSGHTSLGIYRFTEDGMLEICMNQARGKGSDKRPTKFETKPSVGSILYVFKREEKK
jgi:uncharacterized protein (TIGR03067 family)